MPAHAPPRLRWVARRLLLPALVGLAGAWLATAAFARMSVPMGPFHVQLGAGFGRSVTDIALPPLGQLTADTHTAPLRLTATLQDIDVQALQSYIAEHTPEQLASEVERQALDRLPWFALRVLGVGLAGALVLSLIAFRRDRRAVSTAVLSALVILGGSEALTVATYEAQAFRTPAYSGTLTLAPQLFGPIESTVRRIDYFQTELQRIVDAGTRAYTAVQTNPLGRGDEIRVLHISDIHLSPLGYEFAQKLAEGFDVNFVIDTGDVTSFGSPAENLILKYVPGFGLPYVFVRGSHDSPGLQKAMQEIPNARVLDGSSTTIDGITIYGLGDPYFVKGRGQPLSDQQVADLVGSAGPQVLDDVTGASVSPDVVAVHDDRMAEAAGGSVPLVVSGHFHENTARVEHGTLFLRVGTTGGAGPMGFVAEGKEPLSAEILYFRPAAGGRRPALVAWDVIEQQPATGNLTVVRHVGANQFGAITPSPPPTASSSATPSPSPTIGTPASSSG